MTQATKHVSITEHKGWLAIEYHTHHSVEGELVSPLDSDSMGHVVMDVKHVGVSKEAYEVLQKIKRGNDGMAVIDLFKSGAGYTFGTFGGIYCLIEPDTEGSNTFVVPSIDLFQVIENVVPQGAKDAIDEA